MRYLPEMCLFRNVGIYRIYPKLLQFLIGKTIGFQVNNFVPTNWMVGCFTSQSDWRNHPLVYYRRITQIYIILYNYIYIHKIIYIYCMYVCIYVYYIYILYMWVLSGLNLWPIPKLSPLGFLNHLMFVMWVLMLTGTFQNHPQMGFFEARMCCTDLHGGGAVRQFDQELLYIYIIYNI
jgi:hypothetical protein